MKIHLLIIILILTTGFVSCQPEQKKANEDELFLLSQKENKKYSLTAAFYGIRHNAAGKDELSYTIIQKVVLKKTGGNVEGITYNATGQIPAGDFYFTEVWSPDEEYLVLPIGKFEGFAIFKAKDALNDIKANKYFDTIKTKSVNSGWFWHDFEKWEDNSTISFRAGLYGDMFAFKYNFEKKALACYQEKCEEFDIGFNNKGKIKPIKKGIVEPLQVH
jgi:hypothetical protein